MSTGSNSHSNSNHHPLHPREDREALSALFDGELPGDAIRFALRRLDHDAGWREACGRWQLIGDALRGEATFVAPPDFASGVMRMLAAEGAVGVVTSPASAHAMAAASPTASGRRWIAGGAGIGSLDGCRGGIGSRAVLALPIVGRQPAGRGWCGFAGAQSGAGAAVSRIGQRRAGSSHVAGGYHHGCRDGRAATDSAPFDPFGDSAIDAPSHDCTGAVSF
jgi:hypothetical protein